MAVVITTVLPEDVTEDMVRQVNDDIGDVVPEGLIASAATYDEHRRSVRIVGLWQSEKAYDDYVQQHLGPAVGRAADAAGIAFPAPVSSEVEETITLITGRD
jgi:hypothetical protein